MSRSLKLISMINVQRGDAGIDLKIYFSLAQLLILSAARMVQRSPVPVVGAGAAKIRRVVSHLVNEVSFEPKRCQRTDSSGRYNVIAVVLSESACSSAAFGDLFETASLRELSPVRTQNPPINRA